MNIYALELARLPNSTFKILLRLAKTMRKDKPNQTNDVIEAATIELDEQIVHCNDALTARVIANNPEILTSEVEFDYSLDGLWILLRRILEGNTAYTHRGLDALPEKLAVEAGLAERREHAKRSRRLWDRLFAADGTLFTKSKYMSQAESMAALLRMIEQEDLRAELDAVVGPELPRLLVACQTHYENMVSARLSRQRRVGHNLNDLRSELRWAMIAYVNAIHSLYTAKKPETADVVLGALQSVLTLRASLARAGGEREPDLDGLVELELPEIDEGELPERPELPEDEADLEVDDE